MNMNCIYTAAANSTEQAKQSADFICTGIHDEQTIQQAIFAAVEQNKNLYFANGIYHIDGFANVSDGGPDTAFYVPNAYREFAVFGQNHEYGFQGNYRNGVALNVNSTV